MGSVPPAPVGNAASFHMGNVANPYQSNAACFHISNAAQQGTSTAVDQHQWRWTPWGPYPCHPEPSSQAGRKRRHTESQPSDSDGTDEDDINPYLTESERRDLLSDSQSDTDSDSEQDEPPAKRRCVPTKDTVKFLRSVVEKPLKNEKWKALANEFPLPSCDPAHPPKLDESIVCLIPKTARLYDQFLSKLQQFSMDAMGPLIYLQEQMEAKTQVEGDTLKAALRCSLTLLGNAAAHVSVERRKCIMKHLNSDLKPLAEGPFPDRDPDLFGKSFGDRTKATADSIKALKGVQSQKRFSWSGGPKYKPQCRRQHWGVSQPNPQRSVFKCLGAQTSQIQIPNSKQFKKLPRKQQN